MLQVQPVDQPAQTVPGQTAPEQATPGRKKCCPWWSTIKTLAIIVVTCAIQALLISGVYQPYGLVGGGVTGIGMLCEYAFGLPSWVMIVALNIPIMLVGLKHLSVRLIVYSIIATITFSLVLSLTPDFIVPIEDPLVAAIFGGALMGAAGAPVIRVGASMGGMDVVSLMLNKKFSFSLGSINIAMNVIIIGLMGLVKGIDAALLSMIAMFVSNVAYNNVLQGMNRTKTVFIISEHWNEIAPEVLKQLHRGVTYIPAKGAYTGQDKTLVYCIVRTVELGTVRRIVQCHDPKAIFSIIDTREVVGRGFTTGN